MVSAQIAIHIFTLVKITIINILLHCFNIFMSSLPNNNASPTCLIRIVQDVSIGHVLSMDICTPFYHRQLLVVQILVRIRCETTRTPSVFFVWLLVLGTHH